MPLSDPDHLQVFAGFTPEGALELLERVTQLEAHIPATVPPDADQLTLAGVNARLDRHREDLDAIKGWLNGLSRYLGLPAPTTSPAAPTAAASTPESFL